MNATRKSHNCWRYGRTILYSALAVVVMAAMGAAQALALDGKVYPASMCVQWAGSSTVLPVLNDSRLFNPSTTIMRLDCPAVHDSINNSIERGYVDVIDNHADDASLPETAKQVCALLVSASQVTSSTTTVRTTPRVCSTGAKFQSQRLSFGGLPADRNAHYYYSVSIPPVDNGLRSAIISYFVDEND
jgi:hypothetical protein